MTKTEKINLPAPHSFWRAFLHDGRRPIVMVIGYRVEPSWHPRGEPTTFVEFRYGAKEWEVSSIDHNLWELDFTPATWSDWIKQETAA